MLQRLDKGPIEVETSWRGEKQTVSVDRDIFATDLRFLLYYAPGASRVPAVIHRAAAGTRDAPGA